MRETVTIKRTNNGYWMQRFDNYDSGFRRISEKEALESISAARSRGDMYAEDNEHSAFNKRFKGPLCYGYFN